MEKLMKMTLEELRDHAKDLGIPCPARKDKETLIKLIEEKAK